ncbi:MAG: nitronate monooxygenase, partial [Polyangiales bacterium]
MSAQKRTTKPPQKKRKSAAPKAKAKRTTKAPPKKRTTVAPKAKTKTRARKSKPPVRITAAQSSAPKKDKKAKTTKSALHTRICDMFGIEYPIIQTGMGWVSGATLTSATSRAGGLGILAAATMTFRELQEAIAKVKSRTDKPFGV